LPPSDGWEPEHLSETHLRGRHREPWNFRRGTSHSDCRRAGYRHPNDHTLATFTVEFHIIRFFEGSTLVKEIRHIDTTGTIYRSDDLSKTIPYGANLTRTLDPASNTITITGLFRYTHPDGSGMVALDAGRTFVIPPTVITDTGPTQVQWQMAVCAILAAE
jgi:hypothetical protein